MKQRFRNREKLREVILSFGAACHWRYLPVLEKGVSESENSTEFKTVL